MLNNPICGPSYAVEFQSSGLPYITSSISPPNGSPICLKFPNVTRSITVKNNFAFSTTSNTIEIGFTRAGLVSTNNKYVISGSQNIQIETRVTELWIQAGGTEQPSYSVLACLTNISSNMYPVLTGTFTDGSPGWEGVG